MYSASTVLACAGSILHAVAYVQGAQLCDPQLSFDSQYVHDFTSGDTAVHKCVVRQGSWARLVSPSCSDSTRGSMFKHVF